MQVLKDDTIADMKEARKGKALQRMPALVVQFLQTYRQHQKARQPFDIRKVLYVAEEKWRTPGFVCDDLQPKQVGEELVILEEISPDTLRKFVESPKPKSLPMMKKWDLLTYKD